MKLYSNSEVLTMLEKNPDLQFEYGGCKLRMLSDNLVIEYANKTLVFSGKAKWRLIQRPVAFMDAMNSGKRIKHVSWSSYYTTAEAMNILSSKEPNVQLMMMNSGWNVEESGK